MYETDSGIILPGKAPPPPVHPAVDKIRARLAQLADDLGEFEQTTHGSFAGRTIEEVCDGIRECVLDTSAFTISELSQRIRRFLKPDTRAG